MRKEELSAIIFIILAIIAIYRLRKRKINLIDINSDNLVLTKLLVGEIIIYSNEIDELTILENKNVTIRTKKKKFTVDDIENTAGIIKFCSNNNIPICRKNHRGRKIIIDNLK